jgi:methionine-rich copper-binding protein CopC
MTMKNKHLASIAALLLGSILASSALAHAKLQASEPKAGATVAAAPAEIKLQFNEALELPFSKIKLVDARDAIIEPTAVALDKADPKAMVATLPALPAGPYRVLWSTMTRDGHKVKGEYSFTVK